MAEKSKLPILVTRGNYVFPTFEQVLEVGREVSTKAIKAALESFDSKILVVSQKKPLEDDPKVKDIFMYGVYADFKIKKEWKDGTITISINALNRAVISNITLGDYFIGEYEIHKPVDTKDKELSDKILAMIKGIEELPSEVLDLVSVGSNPNVMVDAIAHFLTYMTIEKKQEVLEEEDPLKRLGIITTFINSKKQSADIENSISKKIKTRVDEQQKEFYLREKLKAIKEELGDLDGDSSDMKKYRKRLETEAFPENIKERILQEIDRFEGLPSSSSEANIIRTYIDWMMQIPWWEKSEEKQDLVYARKVLDEHHFGLKQVKDRIIEYLAVKQQTNSLKGQIITLVGPPGVGKTSLAKSIAEAMGRNFVKVSLGGVKDESEIRGHRKTYIGAMPGRIIQGMKRAGTKNPVFLLDEIDKMASDYKGDPSSALLEVLDPEQNSMFSDHYIEENYDLSDVVFIATANYPENIPEALYDRMEIIELSSYTELEKMHIAKDYLLKKVFEEHNITSKQLKISDEAIEELIKFYTREAGVRQLERWLAAVARKFIVKMLNKEIESLTVTPSIIHELLGKRIFEHTDKEKTPQIGVVNGLAYTQFGGDILPIEVNHFPGKGSLILTGKLGDVMKESATIALDYIKANHKQFKIPREAFEENDFHIHVPAGAVPKDGPSAGITLTTAIISALTNKPVSQEIGMTGEITLRGLVLPIGGLREKSVSALRSGLKKIIIPEKNIKDVEELPEEVKVGLEIKPVETYEQVYKEVFGEEVTATERELPLATVKKTDQNSVQH